MASLRAIAYGGGKMPLSVIEQAMTLFPNADFTNAYGLTETSSTIAVLGPQDHRDAVASDVDAVRRLAPLPDTAAELRAVARALGAGDEHLYLGEQATETRVKSLDLSRYRTLAFATHGLMAGEFKGLAEPALVLTPPEAGTPEDDGLLTASEAAQLKLNADWVILSACNTASPDGAPGAEGLSGLARAFFYAGSRALLVSHWQVDSDAAVRLTTGLFEALREEPRLGRAEALRRSMLALMNDSQRTYYRHPIFWAPFMVVGEGGVNKTTRSPSNPRDF